MDKLLQEGGLIIQDLANLMTNPKVYSQSGQTLSKWRKCQERKISLASMICNKAIEKQDQQCLDANLHLRTPFQTGIAQEFQSRISNREIN